jgi:hypothetical protein
LHRNPLIGPCKFELFSFFLLLSGVLSIINETFILWGCNGFQPYLPILNSKEQGMNHKYTINRFVLSAIIAVFMLSGYVAADQSVQDVNWRISGGGKIKQIRYFKKSEPLPAAMSAQASEIAVAGNVINSPPVDGFVPWIVAITTNKNANDDTIWTAAVEPALTGSLTASNIQDNYALAIFDTGASAHVFGYHNAIAANLNNSTYRTNNMTTITGVTGAVDAYISKPIGLFVKGLAALEPNSPTNDEAKLRSTAGFVGQSNVAIIIGSNPGPFPDLATAIGSPLSVYYTTHIRNDTPITITRGGQQYTAPDIQMYSQDDPAAPSYVNKLPLELRPLGGIDVEYIAYNLADFLETLSLTFEPTTPSIIVGNSYQSLFFVHSVDLTEGGHSTLERERFMLDTGAQISVIGSRVAARLGLRPSRKDFEVEIEGVTGETIMAPGFFIDSLTIPTIGEWLEFTNVPVILLDISSPEGGKLDGIIGMNLFTQYNLIFKGGGLFLLDDPVLEFKRIGDASLAGDIAPLPDGDGAVDAQDFNVYSQLWKTTTQSPNWNPKADIAPAGSPDGIIDLLDLARFAENWLNGV